MKFISFAFTAAIFLGIQIQDVVANKKCQPPPPSSGCYTDRLVPGCESGNKPCYGQAVDYRVCPWKCGEKPPANCKERCKPCKDKICIEICVCEMVCPITTY